MVVHYFNNGYFCGNFMTDEPTVLKNLLPSINYAYILLYFYYQRKSEKYYFLDYFEIW